MPTRKVLGQSALAATTLTDVYTVPGAAQSLVETIAVTNLSATPTSFRVSIAMAGAVDDPSQYLYYNVPIPGNETFESTLHISLRESDVVRAYTPGSNITVQLFGIED